MATAVYPGNKLFQLKATHGLPLDITVDRIINTEGLSIEWPSFVEEARRNERWDFQTVEDIEVALTDADVDRKTQAQIIKRVKNYMQQNPLHAKRGQTKTLVHLDDSPYQREYENQWRLQSPN